MVNRNRWLCSVVILLVCVTCLVSSGCSPQPTKAPASSEGQTPEPQKPQDSQPKRVALGTFTQGGNWFIVGGAVADVVNKHSSKVEVTAIPSKGGMENVLLTLNGEIDMGFCLPQEALAVAEGSGEYAGKGGERLRQLYDWNVFSQCFGLTLAKSGIRTVHDLKGKRVSVGAPQSSALLVSKHILEAHGMTLDDVRPYYDGLTETLESLKNGTIDATLQTLTPPASAITEICLTHDVKFIEFDESAIDTMVSKWKYAKKRWGPELYKILPAEGQLFPGYSARTICAAELDEDVAYEFVKSLYDNLKDFATYHPLAAEHTLEGACVEPVVPLHPGAARYFKEKGVLR